MSWQYNGIAGWQDIIAWCNAHLTNDYTTNGFETIYFNSELAQVYFLLRWS